MWQENIVINLKAAEFENVEPSQMAQDWVVSRIPVRKSNGTEGANKMGNLLTS
jgi:hypothetical protein